MTRLIKIKNNLQKPSYLFLSSFLLVMLMLPNSPQPRMIDNEAAVTQQQFSPCSISNTTFKAGEQLTHKVYYNWNFVWMSAGESVAQITNKNSREYKVSIVGKTYSSYDWFYKIRDYYETTLNKNTLSPSSCLRNIKEGGYTLYDKVDFDYSSGNKAISYRGKTKSTTVKKDYDVSGCMHDIVSMIYFFRNINYNSLSRGTELPMTVFMDREEWKVKLRYDGKETIKVKKQGKFKAIKLSTRVTAGELFDDSSSISIWVSDDKNKIPLLVELELAIGSVKVVLKDYQGLRYPLSAKL